MNNENTLTETENQGKAYSKLTDSFYDLTLDYLELPDDLIDVSEDDYSAALISREENRPFEFVDGKLTIYDKCPGQFYEWDAEKKEWILNETAKSESIRLQNNATKKELVSFAESRISLIQDEIDLEMTKDLAGAKADLRAWKKHRILVYRTNTSIESPEWPRRPDLKE